MQDVAHKEQETHTMSEIRYAIRMTTAKGEFWWTGSMTERQDFGHGRFATFGWSESAYPAYAYAKSADADKKAASLESSLQRMFDFEIEVDPVQWSIVWGWRIAEVEPTKIEEPA